jgi:hypothetical protein
MLMDRKYLYVPHVFEVSRNVHNSKRSSKRNGRPAQRQIARSSTVEDDGRIAFADLRRERRSGRSDRCLESAGAAEASLVWAIFSQAKLCERMRTQQLKSWNLRLHCLLRVQRAESALCVFRVCS